MTINGDQQEWKHDSGVSSTLNFQSQICNLQSVVSANTEVQTSDIKMQTAVAAIGGAVRAIARCVVAAVGRAVVRRDNALPRDAMTTVIPVTAGVSVPVVNVAATMANIPMAAAVTMATAVMEVSSRCASRWNQEGQGSTSEGNHQKAFHVSVPLKGGRSERWIGNAHGVPNHETSVKHRVFTFCRRFAIAERSHIDTRLSSLLCHPFDCFLASGVIG